MRGTSGCLLLLAALLAPGLAIAQVAAPLNIVPVIAKLGGADSSDWMTDLTVSNVSTVGVSVSAQFFRENTSNLPLFGPSHHFDLAPGATLTVEDVLGTWFPAQGETKGWLLILAEPDGGDEGQALVAATARVYNNADPEATYGQAVPSALLHVAAGRARAVLPGARWDEGTRSNVGVTNLSLNALDVIVTVFAADGSELSSQKRRVKGLSLSQWSLNQLGVDVLTTPGRVEVRVDPATIDWDPCAVDLGSIGSLRGVFIAYLSRVDRATGDAEFIPAQNDWSPFIEECGDVFLGALQP